MGDIINTRIHNHMLPNRMNNMNTFKVGNKITIKPRAMDEYYRETRDCTAGKVYELTLIGVGAIGDVDEVIPESVSFLDDVGDRVDLADDDITLVEGA